MKLRTIIAAALAFSMGGPIYAHVAKRKPSRRTSRRPFPISPASRWSPWRSITHRARPLRPTPTRSRLSSTPM